MEKTEEIAALLGEIRNQLLEGAERQTEILEFLQAETERTKVVVDRSILLQEIAVQRQKTVQMMVVPVMIVCLGVLAWIIFKV